MRGRIMGGDRHARKRDLARPPRSVPVSLALHLTFGGVLGVVGGLVLAFGSIFLGVFGSMAEPSAFWLGALERTEGEALGWSRTNAEVNGEPVISNGFVYTVGGTTFEGEAYDDGNGLAQGEPVEVEYVRADPARARIVGMRGGMMPAWVLILVSIFPAIGAMLLGIRVVSGRRAIRMLRAGRIAEGRLLERRMTNTRVNDQPVWALEFEFEDEMGRTHTCEARAVDTGPLEDEPTEVVLYDPFRPEAAVVLDALGDRVEVDDRGHWAPVSGGGAVLALLPAVVGLSAFSVACLVTFG
ncbi:MAG: DUF3592 domain-containing protein [Planctomycetota bacterium]|jgi:hypothetical protein